MEKSKPKVIAKKTKVSAKEALDFLDANDLSPKDHTRLLGILNKNMGLFPIADVIVLRQDGATCVNGRELDMDELIKFRQGISAIRDNWAFKLIMDQVLFEAVKHGVHYGDTPEKIMFSKSATYFCSKFAEVLAKFSR